NEELQSTNEELQTAKEELQSTNEELNTVNDELEQRNDELKVINADLQNILNGVDIPLVILDEKLRIRRFTNRAQKIWNVIQSDIGRPLTDIAPVIGLTDLSDMLRTTLNRGEEKKVEVYSQKHKQWFDLT